MKLVTSLSFISILVTLNGCQGDQTNSGLNGSIDRPGEDITVLQAWLGDTVYLQLDNFNLGGKTFSLSACSEKERSPYTGSDGQTSY